MAWELEIITIDVGQGESALIVAYDPISGQSRTMLVDAGLAGYASTVNSLVGPRLDRLGTSCLDHLVVSHYDEDHSAGVVSLLEADNYWLILSELANAAWLAAATTAAASKARPHVVAAAAAAIAATAKGGYDGRPALPDCSGVATNAGTDAENATIRPGDDTSIVEAGIDFGYQALYGAQLNPSMVVVDRLVRRAALAGARAAADTVGNAGARALAARQRMADQTGYAVARLSRFKTRGRYAACNVIDLGTSGQPDSYAPAIRGRVLLSGYAANTPRPTRTRTSVGQAQLGDEILWGTGPGAGTPIRRHLGPLFEGEAALQGAGRRLRRTAWVGDDREARGRGRPRRRSTGCIKTRSRYSYRLLTTEVAGR